jgi:hypothetical protein
LVSVRLGKSLRVTFSSVMQAALYTFTTITSVTALAVGLFGSAAALERWLDSPSPPRRAQQVKLPRQPNVAPLEPEAQTQAA